MKHSQTPEFEEVLEPGVYENSGFGKSLSKLEEQVMAIPLDKIRAYASFFEWHGPDNKHVKELGLALAWLQFRFQNPSELFKVKDPLNRDDPPDIVFEYKNGDKLGIELTELVDPEIVRAHDKGNQSAYRIYTEDELRKKIAEIVLRKSKKPFKNGPYKMRVLLIHSDEGSIQSGEGRAYLSRVPPFTDFFFDEVWIITPATVDITPLAANAVIPPVDGSSNCSFSKIERA